MSNAWEDRFRAGTAGWERPGINPAFTAWRADGTLQPGRILVPGAGRSPEPAALQDAGFDVTVVDIAPTAVATQAARLGRRRAIESDLLAWDAPTPFDAVYDQTCLCALPPDKLPAYESRLHAWLRPNGLLAILFMQKPEGMRDSGPPFHCDLIAMRRLFAPTRWHWPASLPARVAHPSLYEEQPAALRRK